MRIAMLGQLDPDVQRPETWAADKPAILRYLNDGLGVSAARTLLPDEMDPMRPLAVNVIIYTDGEWVWSAEHIYYAEHHDIPIDPELIEYARGRNFEVGDVPESAIDDAMDALDEADEEAEAEEPVDSAQAERSRLVELTPYQWCSRFARGELDREQLINLLAEYPYTPTVDDREWNDAVVQPPGTVDEIEQASIDGLIDVDLYTAIIDRLRQQPS
ncbi:hypothetical protein [Microlunatus soli]|uniref:Uncharacterized protein n=1 Tax=Microlunatus soli TaxID=630515 RepID=A0A1H1T161_9ACTN|nr:hypothetical protein [Microlunatus soli]SDS53901.1 hypothetical protein SAMN04489812_2213 [Microlunatus soli]